jgi:2-desacetyl-2-hydroxyethyl bacteriochlorophyllide A dehydrogenase
LNNVYENLNEGKKMKAAVFFKKHDLRVMDVKKPVPGENEVLIKVMACGVCGTDVHIYEGSAGATEPKPQTILGHEFSGVVSEVGSAVKKVAAGDKVTVNPNDTCGKCYYCTNGQEQFCEDKTGIGTTADGGFAEYIVVREKTVYRVDDRLSYEEAAMAEPVACCLHGIDLAEIKTGDTVLIIGGGTIGLIMLQLARLSGASKIIVSEPIESKRSLASKLSADLVIDPSDQSLEESLRDIRINVAIECVGNPRTMLDTIKYTGKGGHAMLFGLTDPKDEIPIRPYEIFQKEVTIRSSYVNPYTHSRAVAIIESGGVKIKELISDKIILSEINNVFEGQLYRNGKIIITPHRTDH